MVLVDAVLFIIGTLALVKGSDWLVNHASKIARTFNVSEFLIGFTLVAFTTSLPELAVSLLSVHSGISEIATGTIIGSNITNIGFVLAIVIFLIPLGVEKTYLKDSYVMIIASLMLAFFLIDGLIFVEGIVLVLLLIYQANLYKLRYHSGIFKKVFNFFHRRSEATDVNYNASTTGIDLLVCMGSGLLIVIGANLIVASTINISTLLRVPEYFISIIAIAIGTSLPEITTSFAAAFRGIAGISVGNIIGSNIFNISILGIASIFSSIGTTDTLFIIDIPITLALTLLLVIFMHTKRTMGKLEGTILLAVYAAFIYLQISSL